MAPEAKPDAVNEPPHIAMERIARLEQAVIRAEAAAAQIISRHAHLRSETQTAIKELDTLIAGTEGRNG